MKLGRSNIISYNENKLRRNFSLMPSLYDVARAIFAAIFVLCVINLIDVLKGLDNFNYSIVAESMQNFVGNQLAKSDSIAGAGLTTIIFWSVIGLLAYFIVWLFGRFLDKSSEDVPLLRRTILPIGAHESTVIHEKLIRLNLRILGVISFFVWTIYVLSMAIPRSSELLLFAFSDIGLGMIWPIVQAVGALTLCFLTYEIIIKIILLRRSFS